MKKIVALASAILVAGGIAFPTAAAQAACGNYAIWTYADGGVVKRWSTSGKLISTTNTEISSFDLALSPNLQNFLVVDNQDGALKAYNSSTGEFVSGNGITGGTGAGNGAAVVSSGNLLVDANHEIHSINLSSNVQTLWADLNDATSDLPVDKQGGGWSVAGDMLQLPDGDVLVLALNSYYENWETLLLRVNSTTTTDIDVVGVIDTSDLGGPVYGAARAGDNIFLATAFGALLKLGSIPTVVSTNPVALTEIVPEGSGGFYGAAGSNDGTAGSATCSGTPSVAIVGGTEGLAKTGGSENVGVIAGILVFATAVAGVALRRRRRTV
jgi:LPXTG-motif cell wall-anchored protein